jgi:hypothetical protein
LAVESPALKRDAICRIAPASSRIEGLSFDAACRID